MDTYTLRELREEAKRRGLIGYSKLKKDELYAILYPKKRASRSRGPPTYKRPIKRTLTSNFILPKCGMSVFQNFSGICGFNSVIVALFFCDEGREVLWPITFKFKNESGVEGMIPVQLNSWDASSEYAQLNNISIILEIIRGNIQISLESMLKYGPYDKLQTFHEFVECNVQACSYLTRDIACSLSQVYDTRLCNIKDTGLMFINSQSLLDLFKSYYNNVFNIDSWVNVPNARLESDHTYTAQGDAFVIGLVLGDGDIMNFTFTLTKPNKTSDDLRYIQSVLNAGNLTTHAIAVFNCNGNWFYYDNCTYIKLTFDPNISKTNMSFEKLYTHSDLNNVIRHVWKNPPVFTFQIINCISFRKNYRDPFLYADTQPRFWNSLSELGKNKFIYWLNHMSDRFDVKNICNYMMYNMGINLMDPEIYGRLKPNIQRLITDS